MCFYWKFQKFLVFLKKESDKHKTKIRKYLVRHKGDNSLHVGCQVKLLCVRINRAT